LREKVGRPGAGRLSLAESRLTDDDVDLLIGLTRHSDTVEEWNLQRNYISDRGARAIASFLKRGESETFALRKIDLRKNGISKSGWRAISDSLDACPFIKFTRCLGGKLEAIICPGDGVGDNTESKLIVDMRDNDEKIFNDPLCPSEYRKPTQHVKSDDGKGAKSPMKKVPKATTAKSPRRTTPSAIQEDNGGKKSPKRQSRQSAQSTYSGRSR
jgi:hypothetical protein